MMMKKTLQISEILKDERSKSVLLVSHCLLNENTRYFGGAFCSGFNTSIISQLSEFDCGLIQLRCPEQIAWGGLLKKIMWIPFGCNNGFLKFTFQLFGPVFIFYSKVMFTSFANEVVKIIEEYKKNGYQIKGLVGIDGSPTCGLCKTLDIQKSLQYYLIQSLDSIEREAFNVELYGNCLKDGHGLLMGIIIKKLKRKNIIVPLFSIDLEEEMRSNEIHIKEVKLKDTI
jgi:predicted secreted protein